MTTFEFYAQTSIDSNQISLDVETVFMETILKLSRCVYNFKAVHQHAFSPNGKLPCLGIEGDVFAGRDNLLKILDKRGYNLDKNLTDSQISQTYCFMALLDSKIKFALDYELWFDSSNYQALTNVSIGGKYPFPLNMIVPGMQRSLIVQDMLARQPVLSTELIYSAATSAFSDISTLLGDRDYFYNGTPTILDAALFSYLFLINSALSNTNDSRLLRVSGNFDNINRHYSRMKDHLKRLSKS